MFDLNRYNIIITEGRNITIAPDHNYLSQAVLFDIIKNLSPRKAPGSDHITGPIIKPIATPLSKILSDFMQLCWQWSWTPTN